MSEINYGATDWSKNNSNNTEFGKGTEFLRLSFGSNLIRVVTRPFQLWKHSVETSGGKSWGFNQLCPKKTASDPCPLCEMGNRPKKRYLIGVIDKKLGQYRILEITGGVYDQITTYSNDQDWGGPTDGSTIFPYDMDLIKNQNPKSPSQTYQLIPKRPKALTAQELATAESANIEELERRSTPPELVRVKERLAKLQEDGMIFDNSPTNNYPPSSSTKTDDDDFFKNYDVKAS